MPWTADLPWTALELAGVTPVSALRGAARAKRADGTAPLGGVPHSPPVAGAVPATTMM